jgi:hypothetical protein
MEFQKKKTNVYNMYLHNANNNTRSNTITYYSLVSQR